VGLEHRLFDQLLILVEEHRRANEPSVDDILAGLAHSFGTETRPDHRLLIVLSSSKLSCL